MKHVNQKRKNKFHSFHKVTLKNEAIHKKREKSKFIKKWNTYTKKNKMETHNKKWNTYTRKEKSNT